MYTSNILNFCLRLFNILSASVVTVIPLLYINILIYIHTHTHIYRCIGPFLYIRISQLWQY